MTPAASVSGLIFAHPASRYFTVGRIGRDQIEDYAARRGLDLAEVERWLRPNLAYEPVLTAPVSRPRPPSFRRADGGCPAAGRRPRPAPPGRRPTRTPPPRPLQCRRASSASPSAGAASPRYSSVRPSPAVGPASARAAAGSRPAARTPGRRLRRGAGHQRRAGVEQRGGPAGQVGDRLVLPQRRPPGLRRVEVLARVAECTSTRLVSAAAYPRASPSERKLFAARTRWWWASLRLAPGQLRGAQPQVGERVPGPVGDRPVPAGQLQVLHRLVQLAQVEQGQPEVHPRLGGAPAPAFGHRQGQRRRGALRVVPAAPQHPQLVVRPAGDLRPVVGGRGGQHRAADLLPTRRAARRARSHPHSATASRNHHRRTRRGSVSAAPAGTCTTASSSSWCRSNQPYGSSSSGSGPLPVGRGAAHRQAGGVPFGPPGQVPDQPGLRGDPTAGPARRRAGAAGRTRPAAGGSRTGRRPRRPRTRRSANSSSSAAPARGAGGPAPRWSAGPPGPGSATSAGTAVWPRR